MQPTGTGEEVAPPRSRRSDWIGAAVTVAVVAMVGLVFSIAIGLTVPTVILAAQGMVFVLLLPSWVIGAVAVWRRRWVLAAVSALLVTAHLVLCLPAATADDAPGWSSRAPTFTLYSANVRYDNDERDAVARSVMDADADVVVLNEMLTVQRRALERAGATRRYRTIVHTDTEYEFGDVLMTRLPVVESGTVRIGRWNVPAVTVVVGTSRVRVLAVHPRGPDTASIHDDEWRSDLAAIREVAAGEARRGPVVVAGDFNATHWHDPFEQLLDAGFRDAHDVLGEGLSGSWAPLTIGSVTGPLIRLDHCVFSDGVWPRSITNRETPGSDHWPFRVRLAARQRSG